MPSIQDVADQINAKLDDINQHTADTVSRLDTLDADLDAGLGNLAEGLLAIWELQKVTNAVLEHQSGQNDTIICWLTNIAKVSCEQLHVLQAQAELQRSMDAHLGRLESIAHLVHAREYVEVLETEATNARRAPSTNA